MNCFVRNNDKLRLFIISDGKTKQGTQRATYRTPEYNVPPFWRISQGGHFCLLFYKKKPGLGRGRWDLAFVTFRWIPFNVIREEVENVSAYQTPGGHLVFPIGPKNTTFVEDVEILLPIKFRRTPFRSFRGEFENVSAIQRSGWPSYFSDRHKNTNLVENVEVLLPVKCLGISLSGFRGEVKMSQSIAAKRRRLSLFRSDKTKWHKSATILCNSLKFQ